MNTRDAAAALEDADLIPCIEGSLHDAKEVVELCLAQDIPALMGREACAKPGCTPKMQVMVRAEDAPRVGELLRARWLQMVEGEGFSLVRAPASAGDATLSGDAEAAEGEPPCPACGTAGPLVAGACGDCGLQLE